jgi:hypothetical protein
MRAFMWDQMKDWLLHGAIEGDEKMAAVGCASGGLLQRPLKSCTRAGNSIREPCLL